MNKRITYEEYIACRITFTALRWQGLELLTFKHLQNMNNEQNVDGLNVSPAIAKPMLADVPIFLKHLPTHRGYPVPYFVPKDENGVYQLKYASAEKINNCLAYHKCCVCFKPLKKTDYWFISGPMGLQSQTDSHPPMHQCCAEYSLKVCPHLFFEKTHRTTEEENAQPFQITQKPKEFFLVKAKRISVINYGGSKIIKYSSHKVIQEYEYVNGTLSARHIG